MRKISLLIVLLLCLASIANSAENSPIQNVKRIVFIGDSITFSGQYIEYIDFYLARKSPEKRPEILNLGLPSENATGLSEPDHPFPRPNLHERLDRVLEKTKPDLLVACYGMNDGIYYPASPERFSKYREGIRKIVDAATRRNIKVWLLTPPPFDPVPLKGRTLPANQPKYSWMRPYERYDDVLARYSKWLLGQRRSGWNVIDLHGPINRYIELQRKNKPDFTMANDGIHLDAMGHWLMARQVLEAWKIAPDDELSRIALSEANGKLRFPRLGNDEVDAKVFTLVHQRHVLLRDAWLTEVGHKRPDMARGKPIDEALKEADLLNQQIGEIRP